MHNTGLFRSHFPFCTRTPEIAAGFFTGIVTLYIYKKEKNSKVRFLSSAQIGDLAKKRFTLLVFHTKWPLYICYIARHDFPLYIAAAVVSP